MKPPKTLQQAIQFFTDYDNCRQFMIAIRWDDGQVRCNEKRRRKTVKVRNRKRISALTIGRLLGDVGRANRCADGGNRCADRGNHRADCGNRVDHERLIPNYGLRRYGFPSLDCCAAG